MHQEMPEGDQVTLEEAIWRHAEALMDVRAGEYWIDLATDEEMDGDARAVKRALAEMWRGDPNA